jgi:uncharacterized membrane protein YccC
VSSPALPAAARPTHWRLLSSALRDAFFFAVDRIIPPDPGFLRARQAVRAVAAGVATLALAKLAGALVGVGLGEQMLGFVLSLFLTAFVRDATPGRQRATILLAVLPGFGVGALAAALRPVPWLADAGLVGVLTVAAYFAARGPRAMAFGIVSLLSYVLSLLGRATLAELPMRLAIVLVAVVVALAVHETLWSERPRAVLARIDRAMRRRIAAMLDRIEAALHQGGWPPGARRWIRQAMLRLDEATVLAETLLGAPGIARADVLHTIGLDVAAEHLARQMLDRLPAPDERASARAEMARLRQAMAAPGQGMVADEPRSALSAALADLAVALGPVAPNGDRETVPGGVSGPEHAGERAGQGHSPPAPPTPRPAFWSDPAVRRAVQVALATSMAILAGQVIPTRWYWAGIVAFVVIVGTRSRGESFSKAARFLAGTVGGVIAGVVLATALAGHPDASFAFCVLALFLAFQAWMAAYAVMIFWITVALGLAFGLLGYIAPDVLLDRLVETVLGATCGIAVSALVLPMRAADVAASAKRLYWRALGALVQAAVPALLAGRGDPGLVALIVALDGRLQDLGAALMAHWRPPLTGPRVWSERPRRLLLACHFRARALGRLAAEPAAPVPPSAAALIETEAGRIAARIGGLCGETSAPVGRAAAVLGEATAGGARAELALILLRKLDSGLGRAETLL